MRVIFSSHTVAREINSNLSHRFRVVIGGIFPSSQFEFRSLFSMSKKTSLESKSTNEDDRDELISATTPSRRITRNVHNESVISDRGIKVKPLYLDQSLEEQPSIRGSHNGMTPNNRCNPKLLYLNCIHR